MSTANHPRVQAWEDEGGAVPPRAPPTPAESMRLPLARQHSKQPQDTAAGCHIRAEADLAQAGRMDTAHGRERFEHSAASWTARGELLARLDASRAVRQAMAKE